MVPPPEPIQEMDATTISSIKREPMEEEEMCEKLIQLSFAKIVNSKSERGGARLHKNLLILHLLQKARYEQRNRLLVASSPMDTTSNDIDDQVDASTDSASINVETVEQMQSEHEEEEDEIDNFQNGQQQFVEAGSEEKTVHQIETDRLTCLSESSSSETRPGTTIENGDNFDFTLDVKAIESPADEYSKNDQKNRRVRRRRSSSSRNLRRINSTSSSSSDSDDSTSSSEENSPTIDEEIGGKVRDCSLKRKFDDSSCDSCLTLNRNSTTTSNCDWYSSPKMACLVHGSTTHQHSHQNGLSGLISVLQSAALTNDVEQSTDDGNDRIYDNETNDSTSNLQRNLSCSGLLELTCES